MADFMKRVEKMRKESGLSQSELCRKLGIPQSTYNNMVHRGSVPRTETIEKFAEEFGTTARYLMRGADVSADLQSEMAELTAEIAELTAERQNSVVEIIRNMMKLCK